MKGYLINKDGTQFQLPELLSDMKKKHRKPEYT